LLCKANILNICEWNIRDSKTAKVGFTLFFSISLVIANTALILFLISFPESPFLDPSFQWTKYYSFQKKINHR